MGKLIGLLLLVAQVSVAQVTVPGPEGDCGFSRFQPLRISHYVENAAIAKIEPQFPPAAKANGVTGIVRVQVLINRRGLVERTCPEYVKDQPRPDRSLVIAAEAAALQWSFSPNFGLEPEPRHSARLKYTRGVLIFNFVLDEPQTHN
jgi:Gram-negative bacterial TonB protein C-terminal